MDCQHITVAMHLSQGFSNDTPAPTTTTPFSPPQSKLTVTQSLQRLRGGPCLYPDLPLLGQAQTILVLSLVTCSCFIRLRLGISSRPCPVYSVSSQARELSAPSCIPNLIHNCLVLRCPSLRTHWLDPFSLSLSVGPKSLRWPPLTLSSVMRGWGTSCARLR